MSVVTGTYKFQQQTWTTTLVYPLQHNTVTSTAFNRKKTIKSWKIYENYKHQTPKL